MSRGCFDKLSMSGTLSMARLQHPLMLSLSKHIRCGRPT